MEIEDLITPAGVIPKLRATGKKHALQELAKRAADVTGLHERAIFDVLLERERLVSDHLGVQTTAGVAREETVAGVLFQQRRQRARALLVGGAGDEEFQQTFHVPRTGG